MPPEGALGEQDGRRIIIIVHVKDYIRKLTHRPELTHTVSHCWLAIAMGQYEPLGQFLRKQRTQEVPLTFREIEKITGAKLPPKAQHHRAWWSNNPDNNVMTKVWLAAGFESAQVDMEGRKLVFRRIATAAEPTSGFGEPARKPYATKDGRHPLRGALKDITHLVPGVDLTEPAFPEWADLLDEKYGPEVKK
jgi:hypothetical protein